MATKKTGRPVGRPTTYDAKVGEEICWLLIEGKSLRKICERDDMPDRRTVINWMEAHPEFYAKYAKARRLQADLMDDLIIDTAESTNSDNANASRVKIAAYQWRASRLEPRRYGDKTAIIGGSEEDAPVQIEAKVFTDQERARGLAALLAKARAK